MVVAGLKRRFNLQVLNFCSPLTAPIQVWASVRCKRCIGMSSKGNTTIDWSFHRCKWQLYGLPSVDYCIGHNGSGSLLIVMPLQNTAHLHDDQRSVLCQQRCHQGTALGKHYAMDNCDTDTIWGVPMLLNGTYTVALPESFWPWWLQDSGGYLPTRSVTSRSVRRAWVWRIPLRQTTMAFVLLWFQHDGWHQVCVVIRWPQFASPENQRQVWRRYWGCSFGRCDATRNHDGNPKIVYPSAGDFRIWVIMPEQSTIFRLDLYRQVGQ